MRRIVLIACAVALTQNIATAQENVTLKSAVVALAAQPALRAEFEDGLVAKALEHDYDAVTSYDLIPEVEDVDDADFVDRLKEHGVGVVLMIRPAAVGAGSTLDSVRDSVSPDASAEPATLSMVEATTSADCWRCVSSTRALWTTVAVAITSSASAMAPTETRVALKRRPNPGIDLFRSARMASLLDDRIGAGSAGPEAASAGDTIDQNDTPVCALRARGRTSPSSPARADPAAVGRRLPPVFGPSRAAARPFSLPSVGRAQEPNRS